MPKGRPLAGTLIAMSERGLDHDGNLIAFLVGGPTPGQFSIRRTEKYDISDAVLLPSGDLLILERKFSWLAGVNIRIRAIPLGIDCAERAGRRPRVVSRAISATRSTTWKASTAMSVPDGETVLTLVSDDNFSTAPAHADAAVHAGGVGPTVVPDKQKRSSETHTPRGKVWRRWVVRD